MELIIDLLPKDKKETPKQKEWAILIEHKKEKETAIDSLQGLLMEFNSVKQIDSLKQQIDSLKKQIELLRKGEIRKQNIEDEPKGKRSSKDRADLEIGIGFDYTTGFLSTDSTLDLRGSLRGLPTISLYYTFPVSLVAKKLQPYLGITTGLVQLWNVQAFDSIGNQFNLSGETAQLGIMGGIYFDMKEAGVFIEAGILFREFRGIKYEGKVIQPATWPRSLDFSMVYVSIGTQVGKSQKQ